VAGAALLGVKLLSRGGSSAEVEVGGRLERYEVAAHLVSGCRAVGLLERGEAVGCRQPMKGVSNWR
jgi:hypothetical protein